MTTRPPESWSNLMTLHVYTWLSHEEGYWSEEAAEICDICYGSENAWLKAIDKLANRFRDVVEACHPYRIDHLPMQSLPDLYCNLFNSALAMINYREIARAFLDDLEESDYFKDRHGVS